MGWGANQWLAIIPETTPGVYDSEATPMPIELPSSNAMKFAVKPGMHTINTAGGAGLGNRARKRVSSTAEVEWSISTYAYPTQIATILNYALGVTTGGLLPSFTAHAFDGIRTRRWLGNYVAKLKLEAASETEEGQFKLTLSGMGIKPDSTDPTFAEPALSTYPAETAFVIQESAGAFTWHATGGSGTKTLYDQFHLEVDNVLKGRRNETKYRSSIYYCGRKIAWGGKAEFTAKADRDAFEAQSAMTAMLVVTKASPAKVLTLNFQGAGRIDEYSDDLPIDDASYATFGLTSLVDPAAAGSPTEFSYSVA